MASIFGHIAIVIGAKSLLPNKLITKKMSFLGALCSILPDLDVLSYYFGISGNDPLSHRGITHSICFAIIWGFLLYFSAHRKELKKMPWIILFYITCTLSHGILDGFTNGGNGILYFYPFSSERSFMPVSFIQVSPIGMDFFSEWGIKALLSELQIIIPSIILYFIGAYLNKRKYS